MKRLLVVGCGFPQLSLIRVARELGVRVIGADMDPRAIGVSHCHEFFPVSTSDAASLVTLVQNERIDAITTTGSELALKTTATVAAETGLPFHADEETVRRCQEKDAMRAAYRAGGVAVPPFAGCSTVDQARAFVAGVGYPIVVKPARGWGQRGVARVDRDDELPSAFQAAYHHATAAGLAIVVVEAWLEGREYSVNAWIEDGELVSYCVTERLTVPGNKPLGVMLAEVYPSGLSAEDEARVVEEARRGARALGHLRGPCYSQVALGPRGCFLFETAARMGGGFDADVTRLASGVDLYRRVLGIALGDEALERSGVTSEKHGGAIAKFLVGRPGLVRDVGGLDEARAVPGIDDAEVFVPIGGTVHPLTDSAKRAGYVLAHGTSREIATAAANQALSLISIDTAKAEQPEAKPLS
jgi:biotin carboxylase